MALSNRELARKLLGSGRMMRLSELRAAGVTAPTLARMTADGETLRLGRGVYQASHADMGTQHDLAQVALRAPKAVICLVSALAFHGLTDQLSGKVWIAIGAKDWEPVVDFPPIKVVRFADRLLEQGVETHEIEGVPVRVFGVAKTVADCFRFRSTVGITVALEGLQEALRQRKASPAELMQAFEAGRIASVARPYLEALTANG